MSTQLQLRKGNTAQTQIFTGALAEVTVDTDQDTLVVHDGVTVGGHYIVSNQQFTQNVANINAFVQSAYNKANTGGVFTGNVSINQNLVVSGNLVVQGNTVINETTINATSISTNDLLYISNTTNAIAPNTGALLIDGGASIDKNLFISEKLIINQVYDYGTGQVQITGNTFVVGDFIGEEIHAQGGTNLYRQSVDLANTEIWNYTNSSPSMVSVVAPDFTTTGVKIQETTANNFHAIEMLPEMPIDDYRYYTHSIYGKAAERDLLFVRFGQGPSGHVTYNLSSGTYTTEEANTIIWTGMADAGNGWYRCSVSVLSGNTGIMTITTGPTIAPGLYNDAYEGVSGYGLYLWNPQLEYGRRPSQFTPTQNSWVESLNDIVAESGTVIGRNGDFYSMNVGNQTVAGGLSVAGQTNTKGISANGVITITDTTESTGNSTGALVIYGGIGLAGNIHFGDTGSLVHTPLATELRTSDNQPVILRPFNNPFSFNPDATFKLPSGGDVVDFSGNSITNLHGVTSRGDTTTNQVRLTGGQSSVNVGTGDLVVTGGVGVGGNVQAFAVYSDNYFTTDKLPLIQPVNQFAQSAYDTANGANGLAAGAFNQANSVFASSNLVNQFAQSSYNTANGANGLAQGAFNQANTVFASSNLVNQFAQSAYDTANAANGLAVGAYGHANNAFNSSNLVNQFAQSAFDTANGANGLAQGAFNYSNTQVSIIAGIDATQNTRLNSIETINTDQNTSISIIQGVDNTQNTTITEVNQFAQAAFNQANSSVQGTSFIASANSVITTNQSGYLVASDAKFISANDTLISSNVNVDGTLGIAGAISKTSGGILANQPSGTPIALDSFLTSEFRTVIYSYTVTAAIGYQYHELVLVHDDISANLLITVETVPTGKIADYSAGLVNGVVTLYANTQSSATFTYTREGFLNTGSNILPTDLQLATASAVDLGVGIVDNPLIDLNAL
jgi:hypothetical protein